MGLASASIRVKDMKKSVDFYTKIMGMKVVKRKNHMPGHLSVKLESPDTKQRLNLVWYAPGSEWYTPYKEGTELDHLMFKVKDAKKEYDRLRKKKVPAATELWEEMDHTMGFLKDPNGIWIGVHSGEEKKSGWK